MKRQDIITDPELSKKLKDAGIKEEPLMGFWFELRRIYKDYDHQKIARAKNKILKWEFNVPKEKLPLYEKTTFSDEIGSYNLQLADMIPAYTLDELLNHLPLKIRIGEEYVRHIVIDADVITICYKSDKTSYILGETVVDKNLTTAVAKMIILLSMQGCMN
ncbi:hypothetical protein KKB18_07635 [bacterium]|nr:hypothetical protein [bacterium]